MCIYIYQLFVSMLKSAAFITGFMNPHATTPAISSLKLDFSDVSAKVATATASPFTPLVKAHGTKSVQTWKTTSRRSISVRTTNLRQSARNPYN